MASDVQLMRWVQPFTQTSCNTWLSAVCQSWFYMFCRTKENAGVIHISKGIFCKIYNCVS